VRQDVIVGVGRADAGAGAAAIELGGDGRAPRRERRRRRPLRRDADRLRDADADGATGVADGAAFRRRQLPLGRPQRLQDRQRMKQYERNILDDVDDPK